MCLQNIFCKIGRVESDLNDVGKYTEYIAIYQSCCVERFCNYLKQETRYIVHTYIIEDGLFRDVYDSCENFLIHLIK